MAKITELVAGMTFAGFGVEGKLSEGGMGAVYVVTQLATGRQRALKLMHPNLVENQALRAKFMQEARIAARIESEHVVDVVGAGIDEDSGVPWLAMEFLRGEDLGAMLHRRGHLELDEVCMIVDQLGHALGAAHAAGIVHRDLKPENVFLAQTKRSDDSFTVKVLDFGIAKLVEEARTSSNTGLVGSPFWMAPEQTERRAAIAPSTDVWALALLVYRLLTGRYFWLTAEEESTSVTAFLRELVLEPIPPVRERAAQQGVLELLPSPASAFEEWFAAGVVRDPALRFKDARVATDAFLARFGPSAPRKPAAVVHVDASAAAAHAGGGGMGPVTTALGTARTLVQDPSAPAGADELHDADVVDAVPIGRRLPLVAMALGGAGIALLVTGFAFRGANRPAPVASTPTAVAAPPPEVRCPADMVPIPGATFAMGSDDGDSDEKPIRRTQVAPFCVDVTEVTVDSYVHCASAKACSPPSDSVDWPGISADDKKTWSGSCNARALTSRGEHPINCVSWNDAAAFCRWAKKRLPSEEEWELVARGPEGRRYPWGNEPPTAKRLNGCGEECAGGQAALVEGRAYQPLFAGGDGWATTAPVRSFGAGKTPTGVYDLSGNVWEWTSTRYCPYADRGCTAEWRATRGGAWNSDARAGVRAADRDKNTSTARAADLGFRCAL
jgi:formylglycine-generating enzyme required for sulfatase activity/tRNA A-37 threonylcarbamoyl transferase component Bud32